MKTDELINMLGTNLVPVKAGELRNALMIALAIGAAAASCLMLAIFGLPDATLGGDYSGPKVLALAFTLGLVFAGASFLIESARPGEPGRKPLILISVLFFALISAGCVALVLAHPAAWSGMIFGPQWAACLICIPLFAVAPFASLIWALRKGAPTNLMRTGAIAGLVAGASKGEGLGNQFLATIRETDAIAHVVRCFEDDNVVHVAGKIDAVSDIETVNTELALADLATVDKQLAKHAKAAAKVSSTEALLHDKKR